MSFTRINNSSTYNSCKIQTWEIILHIDLRERVHSQKYSHIDMMNDLEKNCVAYHRSSLITGDYLLEAKNLLTGETQVIDFVIERKTAQDLNSSIISYNKKTHLKRIELQMTKMKSTGMKRKIVLLEGREDVYKYPIVVYFINNFYKCNFYTGFNLVQTSGACDTISYIISQYKEMQERCCFASQLEKELISNYNTVKNMEDNVKLFLKSPMFSYYKSLRNISGIGDSAAIAIIKHFPSPLQLSDACKQHNDNGESKTKLSLGNVLMPSGRKINKFLLPKISKVFTKNDESCQLFNNKAKPISHKKSDYNIILLHTIVKITTSKNESKMMQNRNTMLENIVCSNKQNSMIKHYMIKENQYVPQNNVKRLGKRKRKTCVVVTPSKK